MATDYGTDVSALPDLDPTFALRSGRAVVGEAVARRLSTPRGSLPYDDDYGFDLRELLGASLSPADVSRVQSAIVAEAEKDERVRGARAQLTFAPTSGTFTCSLLLDLADGPFSLVLAVSAVSVEVLRA